MMTMIEKLLINRLIQLSVESTVRIDLFELLHRQLLSDDYMMERGFFVKINVHRNKLMFDDHQMKFETIP
jgi:hypothetical protein